MFGAYQALDAIKVAELGEEEAQIVTKVQHDAKRGALRTAAVFPRVMLLSFLGLILWFRSKGGYRVVRIDE